VNQSISFDKFLPRLESLRGLAALSVVGYHANDMLNDTVVTGMAPVVLFFVLSGFVLARSLDRDASPARYFLSRLFRLLPAAAATVLLLSALHWCFGFYVGFEAPFDWANIILNALMIRSDINGVMWSMTVECFASPLILASFVTCKRYGEVPLFVICAVLFLLSWWGEYVHLLGGITNLAPLYAFVVGVLLHFAPQPQRLRQFLISGTIAAVGLFLACGLRKQTALTILGETIASAALVYLIANTPEARLFSFLDTIPSRFIGRISYSFYLLHPIGLSLAAATSVQSPATLFALATIYTIPLSWLSWRIIELPFIALGKSIQPRIVIPAAAFRVR
jgi:peptidoglycan/LPS O-acetylase OafA/YrhL